MRTHCCNVAEELLLKQIEEAIKTIEFPQEELIKIQESLKGCGYIISRHKRKIKRIASGIK